MAPISDIVRYFHDCYRSDNRELLLYDFLDRKVEDKVYFEGKEELLNNEYPLIPIDAIKASAILKKLSIFQKEKELLYGTFFICGYYVDFKGDQKRLCAPLFYYPAEITYKDEFYYLAINASERRINYPLLNLLSRDKDDNILLDPLFKTIPTDYIKFEYIGSIVKLFEKYFDHVNIDNVYAYPENASLKEVKGAITKTKNNKGYEYCLMPTSILGIVEKSSSTRGVLNELKELAQGTTYATPLQCLFNNGEATGQSKVYQKGNLPLILSEAQQAILKSSAVNPLTLIVGPPGTGKTYTIGAIAIEHMSRGESVLISSRTDEAVDVIMQKIVAQVGQEKGVVRGGKKRMYTTPLNHFLKALLTKVNTLKYLLTTFKIETAPYIAAIEHEIQALLSAIAERTQQIYDHENEFVKEVGNEKKWGEYLSEDSNSIWNMVRKQYLDVRNKIQTPIWETNKLLQKADKWQMVEIERLNNLQYIFQINQILKSNWNDIKNFHSALKMSSDTEKLQEFKRINFDAILKAFPIWMTSIADVKDVLPFEKEMFDLVIIDEATQCDIASCLPLIQRGKRVVFAGDPSQLRHVSFLSKGLQSILKSKHGLDTIQEANLNYRDHSILDLVMRNIQSGDQMIMLDEHFRSAPSIIAFSNQYFYDKQLKVMAARPDEEESGLSFIQCNGKREKNGTNPIECDALLNDIRTLVDHEREIEKAWCSSIGILSPFRAQVNLLAKLLTDRFTMLEIAKHNLRVGTAYGFQGEERDVMYLSFAVDADSHHSALIHINKPDVFNVSITRARHKQNIYLSLNETDLKANSLFRSYLSNRPLESTLVDKEKAIHDEFLQEVVSCITAWNFNNYWAAFPIAGLKIDLLIKSNDKYFGIDLVGFPGEYSEAFGIERYRILNRAGITVFPLPYSDWFFNKSKTQDALKTFLLSS